MLASHYNCNDLGISVSYRERVAVDLSLLWHIELNFETKKS